jgi:N6-adenosine-specific RNA methylase IME4
MTERPTDNIVVHNTLTREQWASRIKQAWLSTVEGVFATGRALIDAKAQLGHGDFEAMIEKDLPFSSSTARRLMIVSEDQRLTNRAHAHVLPPHWYTLYILTKLPDDVLAAKIQDGTINCEMQRADVQLLLNRITRQKRFEALTAPPLPTDERVHVLYADPPWEFKVWRESSAYGAALEHYPTMTLDDICALPIERCAADDAVLFMWTTAPTLQQAFKVLGAWGFEYKTNMVWDKERQGMGYFVRNQHEHLLIATRGELPLPDPNDKPVSVINQTRGKHSAKPHIVYDCIERMYPRLRKREFFARHWRAGWEKPWGNEQIAWVAGA